MNFGCGPGRSLDYTHVLMALLFVMKNFGLKPDRIEVFLKRFKNNGSVFKEIRIFKMWPRQNMPILNILL